MKIAIFYTGGTIGMIRRDGVLVPFAVDPLKRWLDENTASAVQKDIMTGYVPIDSSDANPSLWEQLAHDINELPEDYDGILILHGTDTMAFTASALSFLLPALKRPVILTGSQLPLSEPGSDAQANLRRAVSLLAQDAGKLPAEVWVFFDGYLFRGNRVTKVDNEGMHAFESPNYPYYLRYRANEEIELHHDFQPCRKYPFLANCTSLRPVNIKIEFLFPGITNIDVDFNSCQAVILMTYGAGNAPTNSEFLSKIQEITKHGILVLNLSQCQHKSGKTSDYEAGVTLHKRGVIDMRDMTLEACYTKIYALFNVGYEKLNRYLTHSLAGEITSDVELSLRYQNPAERTRLMPVRTCLVLQNSKYFDLGLLGDILRRQRFTVISLFVPEDYVTLNKIDSRKIDLAIVLGTNASVNSASKLPWIGSELRFIQYRIDKSLAVMGIGFGGQLIALAAGAEVCRVEPHGREIGFFPLFPTSASPQLPELQTLAESGTPVCEFHGEVFTLPRAAHALVTTNNYLQAFSINGNCLALQFHPEITERAFDLLLSEFSDYVADSGYDIEVLKIQARTAFKKTAEQRNKFLTSVIRRFYKYILSPEKLSAKDSHLEAASHAGPAAAFFSHRVSFGRAFSIWKEKHRKPDLWPRYNSAEDLSHLSPTEVRHSQSQVFGLCK